MRARAWLWFVCALIVFIGSAGWLIIVVGATINYWRFGGNVVSLRSLIGGWEIFAYTALALIASCGRRPWDR